MKIFLWQYYCRKTMVQTAATIEPMLEAISAKNVRGVKALIIEDESDICYLLSNILKQKYVQSELAGSMEEADKIWKDNPPPGIVFLDNHLPDGMGINYIRRLRKKFP